MAREIVGVYVSCGQKRLLESVIQILGMHDRNVFRCTFFEYTNRSGFIGERVLERI